MVSDCELDNTVSLEAHTALGYRESIRLIHFSKNIARDTSKNIARESGNVDPA
jgi:hypothetical protein